MDFSKLTRRDKDNEVRMKTLLELSTRRHNLQKELENLKAKCVMKEEQLKLLQEKVIMLQIELPVLKKQEETVKEMVKDLVRKYVIKEVEVKKNQEEAWGKISNFVTEAHAKINQWAKNEDRTQTQKCVDKDQDHDKIRQLKLEGEVEAMQEYERYQRAKINALEVVKEMLEEDSSVI